MDKRVRRKQKAELQEYLHRKERIKYHVNPNTANESKKITVNDLYAIKRLNVP